MTVNNTDPMVFFSTQGDECPKGMIGIVNPNDQQNLDNYKKIAAGMAQSVSPASVYGGEVANNTDSGANGSNNGSNNGKTKHSSANALHIPVAALAAAVGAVVYLM